MSKKKVEPLAFTWNNGKQLYCTSVGYYFKSDGVKARPKFYLGFDSEHAYKKREMIKALWHKSKLEGHKIWPVEAIKELVGKGIISEQTGENIVNGSKDKIINTVIKSIEEKTKEIDKLREPETGNVPLSNVPNFLATLITQEYTDPEIVAHHRKFLRNLALNDPKESFLLWERLYGIQKASEVKNPANGVTINVGGNMIPLDASENRKQIENIINNKPTEQGEDGSPK